MTEEMRRAASEMAHIAEKNFNLVKDHLMKDVEMPLWERAKLMSIAKDAAKLMKYSTEMQHGGGHVGMMV